jgi:hypothetical protein
MDPQHWSYHLVKMYLILFSVGITAARVGKCSVRRAAARSSACTTWRGGGRGGSARPATPSLSGWTGRRHRTAQPPPLHSSTRRPGQILPTPWNTVPGETDILYRTVDTVKCRVSDPDPDSIRSVDPVLYSESGSGSKRAKMIHKN